MNPADTSAFEIALETKAPTKKMSLIRHLMPKIKLAMARGLSKKEIWESLRDSGLDISYKMFITYMSRIETRTTGTEPEQEQSDARATISEHETSSTHAALGEARQLAARTDYSKLIRNRAHRNKK